MLERYTKDEIKEEEAQHIEAIVTHHSVSQAFAQMN